MTGDPKKHKRRPKTAPAFTSLMHLMTPSELQMVENSKRNNREMKEHEEWIREQEQEAARLKEEKKKLKVVPSFLAPVDFWPEKTMYFPQIRKYIYDENAKHLELANYNKLERYNVKLDQMHQETDQRYSEGRDSHVVNLRIKRALKHTVSIHNVCRSMMPSIIPPEREAPISYEEYLRAQEEAQEMADRKERQEQEAEREAAKNKQALLEKPTDDTRVRSKSVTFIQHPTNALYGHLELTES